MASSRFGHEMSSLTGLLDAIMQWCSEAGMILVSVAFTSPPDRAFIPFATCDVVRLSCAVCRDTTSIAFVGNQCEWRCSSGRMHCEGHAALLDFLFFVSSQAFAGLNTKIQLGAGGQRSLAHPPYPGASSGEGAEYLTEFECCSIDLFNRSRNTRLLAAVIFPCSTRLPTWRANSTDFLPPTTRTSRC